MKAPLNLQRQTLSDRLYEHMLSHIQVEAMQPGDKLPSEASLAELFAVSRPVIRETLAQLKSLGVIEMHNGRASVICAVDNRLPSLFFEHSIAVKTHDVAELLEVRRGLEMQSSTLAAARASAEDVAELETILASMSERLASGDLQIFTDLDVDFHLVIARASKNSMLHSLISAIRGPLRGAIRSGLAAQDSEFEIGRLHQIHRDVVEAISKRDVDAASHAMARHFDIALKSIVEAGNV